MRLNGTLISETNTLYSFQALIFALMDKDGMETYREAALFRKDTHNNMDETKGEGKGHNKGLIWRTSMIAAQDGKFRLFFRPAIDVFFMNKLIPNMVRCDLKFRQTSNEFRLMIGEDDQKAILSIREAKFFPFYVKLDPQLVVQTEELLTKNVALLPFTKVESFYESLPSGSASFSIKDLCRGKIPTSMVIVFSRNSAKLGSFEENPYWLVHENLQRITVKTDTDILYSLDTNFPKDYTSAYYNLYPNNYNQSSSPIAIGLEEFAGGYTVLFLEMNSNVCITDQSSGVWVKQKVGKVDVNLTFNSPLKQSLCFMAFCFSLDVIQIDKNRHVSLASNIFRGLDK